MYLFEISLVSWLEHGPMLVGMGAAASVPQRGCRLNPPASPLEVQIAELSLHVK